MTPTRRRILILTLLLLASTLVAGCNILNPEPTVTPIYVTATPEFIIVTNTFTPSPSPVLAPTLDTGPDDTDQTTPVADAPTNAPPTPSPTTLITNTPTFTPTPTNTPVTPDVPRYLPVGIGPDDVADQPPIIGVPGNCTASPQGGFATVYNNNPELAARLSCPVGGATGVQSAYQVFERGLMIWVSSQGSTPQSAIFVLYNNGEYRVFADTWREGVDPTSTDLQPPSGNLQEPIRGFGKVWREGGGVRDTIGWATQNEAGGDATLQQFERGTMIYLSQTGQTYLLFTGTPGTWTAVNVPF